MGTEQGPEVVEVVVAVAVQPHARGGDAVMQAAVDQPVGEHHRRRCSLPGRLQQRRQHRRVGLPAGREQQRRLASLERCQPRLDPRMQVERARDQPRRPGAGAVSRTPFGRPVGQGRMVRQAEVVVARRVDQAAAATGDDAGAGGDGQEVAPEPAPCQLLQRLAENGIQTGHAAPSPAGSGRFGSMERGPPLPLRDRRAPRRGASPAP